MARLEDLAEIILWKDNGVLLRRSVQCRVPDVEQVGTQREMGARLLQDAEGQNACALRPFDGLDEGRARKFLPVRRQLSLRRTGLCWCKLCRTQDRAKQQ